MNSVATSGSSRVNVLTFSAIQTLKYELTTQKKSAVARFVEKKKLSPRTF